MEWAAVRGDFVGRRHELRILESALADARAERPRVVLVHGPPGMGKSALLRRFLADRSEVRVLKASGDEIEIALTYGVVGQLVAGLPRPLPGALSSLGKDAGPSPDPLTVGAALVEVMGMLQDEGPIVVVLDDVQWADTPSLHALAFALRRLRVDRVLGLLSARDEALPALPAAIGRLMSSETGLDVALSGLGVAEIREMAGSLHGTALTTGALERLRDHTGGNPLHLRALLAELPADALQDDPLPAPRSFAALVLSRLASCPPQAEKLVAAASVLGMRSGVGLVSRLAGLEDPLPAIEAATAAGLVEHRQTAAASDLVFVHPLVRAAVYHDLSFTRRVAIHAGAAELAADRAANLRHRIAATPGEDAELAREVRDHGLAEAERGAWSTAAAAYLAAARLTPARPDREYLLLEAFDCLALAGEFAQAVGMTAQLAQLADEARRAYGLGRLALIGGGDDQAEPLFRASWDCCDRESDPQLAARIAANIAMISIRAARSAACSDWAQRALDCDATASTAGLARTLLAMGLAGSGREGEALAGLAHLPDIAADVSPQDADALLGRGIVRLWTDDLVGARTDLALVVVACRRRGPFHIGLIALYYLAEAEYRLGAWDDSIIHGDLGASQAEDSGEAWVLGLTHAVAAFALAARGRWEGAETHAELAGQAAAAMGDVGTVLWAAMASARIGLARQDHLAMATALEPMLELAPAHPAIDALGIQPWRELYAEALVPLGRLEEAEAALAPLEARAAESGRHSSLSGVARVRGLLNAARGHADDAQAAFQSGLAHAAHLDMPFEVARLDDAYGRFLRRTGQRRLAREHLLRAQEVYSCLEARPFLERVERELAACGLTPARRSPERRSGLTPQELAVARLVAAGKTNREAAAELVVSVKTVGYHLGHVYTKLGVSSRSQLAARFAATRA